SNVAHQNVLLHVVHPPHLALHVPLRGSAAPYVPATNVGFPTATGAAALVLIPTNDSTVALSEGVRNEALRINLTFAYFDQLLDRSPDLLETIAAGIRNDPFCVASEHVLPLGPLLSFSEQVLAARQYGPVRRMYLEGKVVELLATCVGNSATKA